MLSRCFCAVFLVVTAILPRAKGVDFFVVTNKPELDRKSKDTLYQYAITADPATKDALQVSKDGDPVRNARVRNLVRKSDSLSFGIYLTTRPPKKNRGSRYGVYQWSADGETINSFVKPATEKLDTRGVYTITLYRDPDDLSMLSEPMTFGVRSQSPRRSIKWNRGRRREINTGPTLTLTEVKGSAGMYEIYRGVRRRRKWSIYVEVVVSDCELGRYTTAGQLCLSPCKDCQNGAVCAMDRDICICPPFIRGNTCRYPDAWLNRPGTPDYYYIGANNLAYGDARSACQNLGGDLASVTSAEENQFISDLLEDIFDITPDSQVLLGLTYDPAADTGVWVDGTVLDYTNWYTAGGHPLNIPIFTVGVMFTNGDGRGFWRNFQNFLPSPYVCERKNVKDPLIIETENAITCGQLPGGNNKCKGYHFCYGDLYGCSCASGWQGNACDQKCKTGFYGPGCSMRCIEDARCPDNHCDRFTGRCSYSLF